MDDKIEAWVQRAMVLSRHCQDAWGRIDFGEQDNDEAERAELEAHLRTTPEGFRLVPVEPTEAMLQAEIDAVSDYWFDHEELGNRTEATKIGYKAMLAASQESAALKEQSKC